MYKIKYNLLHKKVCNIISNINYKKLNEKIQKNILSNT